MLEATSDGLLKACGIKGGQVVLLKKGLKEFASQSEDTSFNSGTSLVSLIFIRNLVALLLRYFPLFENIEFFMWTVNS